MWIALLKVSSGLQPNEPDSSTIVIAIKPAVQPISGDGIRLRLLTENDLPLTLAWRNRDTARSQFRNAEKLVQTAHRAWFDQQKKLNDRYYFIVENADGGRAVGQVAIYNINHDTCSAEVGAFVVAPEAEGRGFMKRAILELIGWAFNVLKLRRVCLEVFATNQRAIRVYESCGFMQYGQSGEMLLMQKIKNENNPDSPASAGA